MITENETIAAIGGAIGGGALASQLVYLSMKKVFNDLYEVVSKVAEMDKALVLILHALDIKMPK